MQAHQQVALNPTTWACVRRSPCLVVSSKYYQWQILLRPLILSKRFVIRRVYENCQKSCNKSTNSQLGELKLSSWVRTVAISFKTQTRQKWNKLFSIKRLDNSNSCCSHPLIFTCLNCWTLTYSSSHRGISGLSSVFQALIRFYPFTGRTREMFSGSSRSCPWQRVWHKPELSGLLTCSEQEPAVLILKASGRFQGVWQHKTAEIRF